MQLDPDLITGVVLAGGRGARMGGVDKGLQPFEGQPLALHALRRLQPQVGQTMLNANRNRSDYEAFGVPVWSDTLPDYAGPLAGFVTALQHCATPYLMTVPCDTPHFASDLVARLGRALLQTCSDVAMPSTPGLHPADAPDAWFRQPVFCLLRRELLADLETYVSDGGRKIDAWTARHKTVVVPFDDAAGFFNINTLAELQAPSR